MSDREKLITTLLVLLPSKTSHLEHFLRFGHRVHSNKSVLSVLWEELVAGIVDMSIPSYSIVFLS